VFDFQCFYIVNEVQLLVINFLGLIQNFLNLKFRFILFVPFFQCYIIRWTVKSRRYFSLFNLIINYNYHVLFKIL